MIEPFEILELGDGQSIRVKVLSFEWGAMVIHPRYAGAPYEKTIPVLRLHVGVDAKPRGAPYWDLTSKTLQAQLKPLLDPLVAEKRELVITAHGSGPSKRFMVQV